MSQKFNVIITDNDHGFIDQEKEIFNSPDFNLELKQLHTEQEVIDNCKDADGLIIQYAPLTKRICESLPKCQVVSRYGVGYDTLDIAAATEAGIIVANVSDYGTEEVSLQAIALLMQLYRKTDVCNTSIRAGEWEYRVAEPIYSTGTTVLGVLGTGRIGTAFVKKAQALGFKIIVCEKDSSKIPAGTTPVDFETLLKESDYISVHCDLNTETRHMFNDAAFDKMKDTAVIINTARGAIISEEAFIRAMQQKKIAAAGLDVLEFEPPKNKDLLTLDNVIYTPHIAWYSMESRLRLKTCTARNVRQILDGEMTPYIVNPEVLNSPNLRFKKK